MKSIFIYAHKGDIIKLQEEIDQDNNQVYMQTEDFGFTPLHYAASSGQVEAVKLLLNNKADIYKGDKKNETAFYAAISSLSRANGQDEIDSYFTVLKTLLEHEVHIRLTNPEKYKKQPWLKDMNSSGNTFTPLSRLEEKPLLRRKLDELIKECQKVYILNVKPAVKPAIRVKNTTISKSATNESTKENYKQQENKQVQPEASSYGGIIEGLFGLFRTKQASSEEQPLLPAKTDWAKKKTE